MQHALYILHIYAENTPPFVSSQFKVISLTFFFQVISYEMIRLESRDNLKEKLLEIPWYYVGGSITR